MGKLTPYLITAGIALLAVGIAWRYSALADLVFPAEGAF